MKTKVEMTLVVFLVEDSAVIRDNLIATLVEVVRAGVVKVADSESDAKAWIQTQEAWDLAVLDLFLKEGSGLGVLRALQGRKTSQQVVVLSNYATPDMRSQCARLGADLVFDKSTELDEFLAYCLKLSK